MWLFLYQRSSYHSHTILNFLADIECFHEYTRVFVLSLQSVLEHIRVNSNLINFSWYYDINSYKIDLGYTKRIFQTYRIIILWHDPNHYLVIRKFTRMGFCYSNEDWISDKISLEWRNIYVTTTERPKISHNWPIVIEKASSV